MTDTAGNGQAPSPARSDFRALVPLAVATCANIIGLGIVIPLLPFFTKSVGGGDFEAAAIFSVFSACAFLTAPLWGRLSDRVGRKPVLLLSAAVTVLSYIWLANATTLWAVFASRALAGLSAGWLATSQAYVSDITSDADRAKGMGLLGASFGVGFTIGPFIGALTVGRESPDFVLPAYLSAVLTLVGLAIALVFLREPARHAVRAASSAMAAFRVLADRSLTRLFAPYFLVFLIFTGLEGTFALWCLHVLGAGPDMVGVYLGFAGIVTAVVQGGGVGRLSRRFGEAKVAAAGVVCLAAGLVVLGLIDSSAWVFLAMALIAIAMGLHNPAMQSLMSQAAPADWKGGVLGAAQSGASLARIAGPALAGLALTHIHVTAPFWIGAAMAAPVLLMILALARRAGVTRPL